MSDVLAALDPPQVAAFYRRLADAVDKNRGALKVSLAALLMRAWLDNRVRNATIEIDAPDHLQNHSQVKEALAFHRRVYLTREKARLSGGAEKWVGVLPRLQGLPPYAKWNGATPLALDYQSLVELPLRYQITGNDADKDLLYALHGFQIKSYLKLVGQSLPSGRLKLNVMSFEAEVLDRYDWDYSEHLKVPNPDFGSKAPAAVEPGSQIVTVYHKNAKRIEDAGLAAPYDLKTKRWAVKEAALLAPEEVDPGRPLR